MPFKEKARRFQPIIIKGYNPRTGKIEQERRADSKYSAKIIKESYVRMGLIPQFPGQRIEGL